MRKIVLFLSALLITSHTYAAIINFLCPDGTTMRQGTTCAPEAGCHPTGVIVKVEGKRIPVNIASNGSAIVDDAFLNKNISIETGDNFWTPRYCKDLGAGTFFNTFTLQETQTISMKFRPR